jgi:hypothetical protein
MTETLTPAAAEILEQLTEEELLAQFHEGAAPASQDILDLIAEYKAAHEAEKEAKAAKEAAKKLILEEMDKQDVNIFTKNGVPVVQDIHYLQEDWDKKSILKAFPGVMKFITKSAHTRFSVK